MKTTVTEQEEQSQLVDGDDSEFQRKSSQHESRDERRLQRKQDWEAAAKEKEQSKQNDVSEYSYYEEEAPAPKNNNEEWERVSGQLLNKDDYQLYGVQDKLIEDGIALICNRFNQLLDIIRKHGLDLKHEFCHEQRRFSVQITKIH